MLTRRLRLETLMLAAAASALLAAPAALPAQGSRASSSLDPYAAM